MNFPSDSEFAQEAKRQERLIEVELVRPPERESAIKTTSVPTSDLEDLEHDLRELSFRAGSPEQAQTFEDIANVVASFYKG